MEKGLTPEERLLNLIKEGVKVDKQEDIVVSDVRESKPLNPPKIDFKKFFTTQGTNKLLWLIFLFIFIYTAYDLGTSVIPRLVTVNTNKAFDLAIEEKKPPVNQTGEPQKNLQPQPLAYYIQEIEKKDLFKSVIIAKDAQATNQTQPQPAKVKLDELAKTFALKGIVAGQTPQAVIEDTKLGKTYFVIKQDKIGDVTIDDITDTKVSLRFEQETIDLTL